jgi:hypothetical protein
MISKQSSAVLETVRGLMSKHGLMAADTGSCPSGRFVVQQTLVKNIIMSTHVAFKFPG